MANQLDALSIEQHSRASKGRVCSSFLRTPQLMKDPVNGNQENQPNWRRIQDAEMAGTPTSRAVGQQGAVSIHTSMSTEPAL